MRTSELEWEEGSFMKKNSKGFLLATAATGAAAFAPGALAADLPTKAPAAAYVPPAASWAGFYIGVHAGVNWQQSHNTGSYASGDGGVDRTTSTGFIGGGQIGYNWQSGNFVFGIEADGSWLSNKGSIYDADLDYSASNKVRWLATVRPRFGLAVGNTMAYATAGVAFGGVRNKVEFDVSSPTPFSSVSENKTRVGWAVGGGIEHMWTRNWTIALEGLFVDLGRKTVNHINTVGKNTQFDNQIVIGRAKLNYKW
jgi:outer membrane immunogenic protein